MDRSRAVAAIRFLKEPMVGADVKELRGAFRQFQKKPDVQALLEVVEKVRSRTEGAPAQETTEGADRTRPLTRQQLRLICFDLVTGG